MANDWNYIPGQLNPFGYAPGNPQIRLDTIIDDPMSVYRNSMERLLSPDLFSSVTDFQAVVLYELSINAEDTSLFDLVSTSLGFSLPPIRHYICLIPELHAHLVNPALCSSPEQMIQWLVRYPVFIINPSSLASGIPKINPGSIVKVKFTDTARRYGEVVDVVMLNRDHQDLYSPESSSSRDAYKAATYGAPTSVAQPPGPLTDIDETDYLFPVREQDRPPTGLSSTFGPRKDPFGSGTTGKHGGIDVPLPIGTPLVAPCDGTIIFINPNSSTGGRLIYLKESEPLIRPADKNHRQFEFMHLDQFAVSAGQEVKRGDIIAYSGNTGRSTGPHLHLQLREGGSWGVGHILDPMSLYPNMGTSTLTEEELLGLDPTSPVPMARDSNSTPHGPGDSHEPFDPYDQMSDMSSPV